MQKSAIETGAVDFVMTPAEIAAKLKDVSRGKITVPPKPQAKELASSRELPPLEKILESLRSGAGIDFTRYKQPTVMRRITRRMNMRQMKDMAAYARYLMQHREEVHSLAEDMLINVTEFFRDPDIFNMLKREVFPNVVRRRPADATIRVWVPGCSTGEEVYSLAIALTEFLENKKESFRIQFFGTDIGDVALLRARQGIYEKSALKGVSADRLKRFFVKANDEGTYQISKQIRDMCLFTKHNMLTDTPFSRIDIVSCRNVLIYFDVALQKKIIPIFHYALNFPGYLVLGTSETIADFHDLFEEVDKKHRIYTKKNKP